MKSAILGRKKGMTSVFSPNGRLIPVTVIEAGPCLVTNIRTKENDGYEAVQIGYEEVSESKLTRPIKGQFDKHGLKYMRHLKEFRDPENEYAIGQELTVSLFNTGDNVHVSSKSIGRGFQGVVKRHHFAGVGGRTHGQHNRERHPGSIGQSSYPSRVFKGIRMAGRQGGKRTTIRNVEVLEIIPERNVILLVGSVPGPKNTIIEIVKP